MSQAFALALAAGVLVITWIVGGSLLAARRRRRLLRYSLTEAERRTLTEWLPVGRRLPPELRDRLERLIAVFVGERCFVGCGGLTVTPEMKLAIASQACLLVLGRDTHVYDELRAVLVYPSQFIVPEQWHDEHGVVTDEERVLAGQAWDQSRIILSWEDVGARGDDGDAFNVVIHEFAHYLDHESGGAPWIRDATARRRWRQLLDAELERLRDAVEHGERTLLDPYAAEDRAEFFAVVSEAFFEEPRHLAQSLPELYAALRATYRLDPAAW